MRKGEKSRKSSLWRAQANVRLLSHREVRSVCIELLAISCIIHRSIIVHYNIVSLYSSLYNKRIQQCRSTGCNTFSFWLCSFHGGFRRSPGHDFCPILITMRVSEITENTPSRNKNSSAFLTTVASMPAVQAKSKK